MTGRFAPSTTGPSHPGTLLAGLLCWLDARSRGAQLLVRLEDLDPQRSNPTLASAMLDELRWFGLTFDAIQLQSEAHAEHEDALDQLAAAGALYPCSCSRLDVRQAGRRAPDGGYAYSNRCRGRPLPATGWRASSEPLRARLAEGLIEPVDEGGEALAQDPSQQMGDPVVRRRDGAVAYHLASVVDDARAGVTRVVRGRDLAPSTATQVALQRLLALPEPTYRHHLLLLEGRQSGTQHKLSKFHGAVGTPTLERIYSAEALCGILANACGLRPDPGPTTPSQLLDDFSWQRVRSDDVLLRWTGMALECEPPLPAVAAPGSTDQDISYSSKDASPGTPTRNGKP